MAKSKKKKSPVTPDALLASLLREVEWLKLARHDDAVSEEEWHRRGKAVVLRATRLPQTHFPAFQEHYLSMQQLEMVEQLEAGLAADGDGAAVPASPGVSSQV